MENISKYNKALTVVESNIHTTDSKQLIAALSLLHNLVEHYDYSQHLVKAYQQAIATFASKDPQSAYELQGLILEEQQKLKSKYTAAA